MKSTILILIGLGMALLTTAGCSKELAFSSGPVQSNLQQSVDPDDPDYIPPVVDPDDPPVDPDDPPIVVDDPPVDPDEPVTVQENFVQAAASNKLDLLIVIDNSDSMFMDYVYGDIQRRMANVLNTLNGVDYRIGVTTTDVDSGHASRGAGFGGAIEGVITPSTPNKQAAFAKMIDRTGTVRCRLGSNSADWAQCGSNDEQALKAAVMATQKRTGLNNNFFRSDANLAVLAITDEDEMPNAGSVATTPAQALSSMQTELGASKDITFYGVIIQPGDNACFSSQKDQEIFSSGAAYGTAVASAASMTGGSTVSICSSDYAPGLSNIAAKAGGSPQVAYTLSHDPVVGSVVVTTIPVSGIGYTVSGRTITFNSALSAGTQIQVSYQKQ